MGYALLNKWYFKKVLNENCTSALYLSEIWIDLIFVHFSIPICQLFHVSSWRSGVCGVTPRTLLF